MNAKARRSLVDPICGMVVESPSESLCCEYIGQTYAFCCAGCRALFLRAPERIVVELAHTGLNHAEYPCQQHGRGPEPWDPFSRGPLRLNAGRPIWRLAELE
jgi:YHS domain-containing protein